MSSIQIGAYAATQPKKYVISYHNKEAMRYCRVPLRRQDCNIGQTLDAPHATLTIADASPQGRRATIVSVGVAMIAAGPTSIEGNPCRRSARKTFVSAGRSRSGIDDFVIVTSAARGGNDFQRAVIVAMGTMRVMEMPVDQIVDMVAMGDGFVTAARSMVMAAVMAATSMIRRAFVGILRAHVDNMFVKVAVMRMVQVAIV